jgi:hypothetical protein
MVLTRQPPTIDFTDAYILEAIDEAVRSTADSHSTRIDLIFDGTPVQGWSDEYLGRLFRVSADKGYHLMSFSLIGGVAVAQLESRPDIPDDFKMPGFMRVSSD